jgi:deoxyhypusine synthase
MKEFDIKNFMNANFQHFNARVTLEASKEYINQLKNNNFMLVSLAGAMSTAEIGITLSEMIRQGKVHAISCTGANLEEDIYNLMGKESYKNIDNWRNLTSDDDKELGLKKLNRVTDVCIPEQVMLELRNIINVYWMESDNKNISLSPYEYLYKIIRNGDLNAYSHKYKNSWIVAAAEKNLPIFTPGWEDSTLGNMLVASHVAGNIKNLNIVKSGLDQMKDLIEWYSKTTMNNRVGFFQIGGGISGDFAICVVPLIRQDLLKPVPLWSYFCQISDSTTSYGSYSGAVPSEKITWEKIDVDTPSFIIESDASVIAPLMFGYILSH